MTNTTPAHMRELASEAHEEMLSMQQTIEDEWGSGASPDTLRQAGDPAVLLADRVAAAIRAAADQLEAVWAVLARAEAENAPHLYPADIEAALTADTAPQEGRDAS